MSEARARVPGEALLHPIALASLALWIVNDHFGKPLLANGLTGKLSDVASLVVCPLLVLAVVELAVPSLSARGYRVTLLVSLLGIGALMIGVKVFEPAAAAYQIGLGVAQWPFHALLAALRAQPLPALARVRLAMDPTDLLTLPSLGVAWYVGMRSAALAHGARPARWSRRRFRDRTRPGVPSTR